MQHLGGTRGGFVGAPLRFLGTLLRLPGMRRHVGGPLLGEHRTLRDVAQPGVQPVDHFLLFLRPLLRSPAPQLGIELLRDGGYVDTEPTGDWDDGSKKAFDALIGTENLEERWSLNDADVIDRVALDYLLKRFDKMG